MLALQTLRFKRPSRAFALLIVLFLCLGILPTCAARNYDRINQYAIQIGETVWVYGGASPTTNQTVSNIITGLNLSTPWNATTPPWTDYTATGKNVAPLNSFGGFMPAADGSVLYMWGESLTGDTAFARFNLSTKTWTTLPNSTVPNQSPPVWDSDGNGWTWGDFAYDNRIFDNSVFAFNPREMAWTTLLQTDTTLPRRTYFTLVLVWLEVFVIGGLSQSGSDLSWMNMTTIQIFNTTAGTWSNQTAGGDIPSLRGQHTAVLGLDDVSIIIFGGSGPQTNDTTVDTSTDNLTLGDIAFLNTTSMNWVRPAVIGNATARYGHSAALVGDLMLVMYGSTGQGSSQEFTNDIGILNITSWTWQTNFTPFVPSPVPPIQSSSSKPFTSTVATHPSSPISSPSVTPHPSTKMMGAGPLVAIGLGSVIAVVAIVGIFATRGRWEKHEISESSETMSGPLSEAREVSGRWTSGRTSRATSMLSLFGGSNLGTDGGRTVLHGVPVPVGPNGWDLQKPGVTNGSGLYQNPDAINRSGVHLKPDVADERRTITYKPSISEFGDIGDLPMPNAGQSSRRPLEEESTTGSDLESARGLEMEEDVAESVSGPEVEEDAAESVSGPEVEEDAAESAGEPEAEDDAAESASGPEVEEDVGEPEAEEDVAESVRVPEVEDSTGAPEESAGVSEVEGNAGALETEENPVESVGAPGEDSARTSGEGEI